MTPRYDLHGEIVTGAASRLGVFLRANTGPVTVSINSPGGLAMEGSAIKAEIERHGAVTVMVEGIAASAASLAMVGARRIVIHNDAMIMVHNPATLAFGTGDELRQTAGNLDKISAAYAEAYAKATGHPVARIAAWMAVETWMTGEEAVALNFADQLETAAQNAVAAAFDYSRFTNAPTSLVALARANGWSTASTKSSSTRKKTDA